MHLTPVFKISSNVTYFLIIQGNTLKVYSTELCFKCIINTSEAPTLVIYDKNVIFETLSNIVEFFV